MSGGVLRRRALNRTLLERQYLLLRQALPATEAIEHLVGLQAQVPTDPYYGLWSRLADFHPEELAGLVSERQAVRIALMRGTIHLVTARDALAIRPVVQSVLTRTLHSGSPYGRDLAGMDVDELVETGRALVEEQPRTLAQLRVLLGERWPERNAASLAYAVHYLLPLIQVPPRGVWGKSGRAVCTTATAFLGQPLGVETVPDSLLLRYLAAFGPASVADMRTWSRLTGLREAVERLRPRLRTVRDEHGRELFDLPDAPLADPETPAPPRFLPEYDNVLLSHADRSRIVAGEYRWPDGIGWGAALVDGFVCAAWKLARQRERATLRIELVRPLATGEQAVLEEEGSRLLAFAAPAASLRDIEIIPPA